MLFKLQSHAIGRALSLHFRRLNASDWRAFMAASRFCTWRVGAWYLHFTARFPSLVGLGLVAYLFGLRHAFDADHIAAIDDTVRFMLQKGRRPLAVGFFFSLGHSTLVVGLAIAIAGAAGAVTRELPQLQKVGEVVGTSVSGVFLWVIGALNLFVLLDLLKVWRQAKSGAHSHAHLETLLQQRVLLNRLFGGRLQKVMNHSWQMFPLGFLFGLGFDTASEVGSLAMTAGALCGQSARSSGTFAAHPICRWHDAYGHDRWGLDVTSVQLGAIEPGQKDFLQRRIHGSVSNSGARDWFHRADAGPDQRVWTSRHLL